MAVKTVNDIDEAIRHISEYGSRHSECIMSEDEESVRKFQLMVDASCVYANVSTAFTDGGQFGFGAEIGISTRSFTPADSHGASRADHLQIPHLRQRSNPELGTLSSIPTTAIIAIMAISLTISKQNMQRQNPGIHHGCMMNPRIFCFCCPSELIAEVEHH